MKKRSIIMSFAAVTVILSHLMMSGGIIMVHHYCSRHHSEDVTTFSLINTDLEKENCCGTGEEHQSSDSHISAECCEYDISDYSFSSFVTTSFSHDKDFQATSQIFTCDQLTPKPFLQTARNITFFNKHGGRYIVNINHQIIS
jgi:hypothetical protein